LAKTNVEYDKVGNELKKEQDQWDKAAEELEQIEKRTA
jgi:hypothetical protein